MSYNANGGAGSYSDSGIASRTKYEVKCLDDTGISYVGYTFKEWNTQADGNGINYAAGANIEITDNMALYAQWEKDYQIGIYMVIYDANGGSGSYADIRFSGEICTISNLTETGITREEYIFTGWNTQADGNGINYEVGAIVTENLTLYVQWKQDEPNPKDAYTVFYDSNGGSGSYTDSGIFTGANYTVKNLTETGITRKGYTFMGWNTQADGNGISYGGDNTFTVSENITLYAQWKETVVYNKSNDTGSTVKTTAVKSNSPKTGDEANTPIYILLFAASMGIIIFSLWRRRPIKY